MLEDDADEDWCVVLDADGRVAGSADACLTTPAVFDGLVGIRRANLAALRSECQRAAWPLAQSSFWLPADATPEGALETLASRIFEFHTAGAAVERASSGAEWWANVTRSEMLHSHGDIHLHFDKDEHAFAQYGLVVHPLLATVTYLSDAGASTVVAPHVVLDAAAGGQYARQAGSSEACALLVPPRVGRHVRFDGRWLHGAPASYPPAAVAAAAAAPYERFTFCVNIWVGHKPGSIPRFSHGACRSNAGAMVGSPPEQTCTSSPPDETTALPNDCEAGVELVAPRLRLCSARGEAALREAREARIVRVRSMRSGGNGAIDRDPHCLRLEQTDEPHELLLPVPKGLSETLAACSAGHGGQAVLLTGDAITIRRARSAAVTTESVASSTTPEGEGLGERRKRRKI